jgi:coenzyme Q-binding protein COQ10
MPAFRTTRTVRHAPERMFDLVADVERYPEFLPFCESLVIRRRTESPEGLPVVLADMRVGYRAINERFTSRVTLDRPRLKLLVEYVDGPFSFLENRWSFTALEEGGCRIDFFISYEFRSRLLGLVAGAAFDRIFRMFAGAFEARADQIHGAVPPPTPPA